LRPSDNYLVIAGHLLWDLWRSTGLTKHFLRATTLLHIGEASSPCNWQIKLLLIRLYGAAGCGSISATLHGNLDIKHLMLDSLGWLLPRQLWGSGHLELAITQLNATVRLYNHVNKDTADHIITAYRSGTFYQIRDIYRLRARITHSHHFATVDTERVLLQLLMEVSQHNQAISLLSPLDLELNPDSQLWDRLEDNRDLSTMVSWDPPELQVQPREVEESYRLEVQFARSRHLLLRCLAAVVNISEDASFTPTMPSLSSLPTLVSLVSSLKAHWTLCQSSAAEIQPPTLLRPQAPEVPRLVPYCHSGQMESILLLLDMFLSLSGLDQDTASIQSSLTAATALVSNLGGGINTEQCGLSLLTRGSVMEQLMWNIETLGLLCIILGAAVQTVSITSGKGGKKGKKGKPSVYPAFEPLVKDFNLLHSAVEGAASKLERSLQDLEKVLNDSNLAESLELLSLTVEEGKLAEAVEEGEQGKEVLARMEQSYRDSLQQMRAILQNKQSYLRCCKILL